jgi:hypothetical protein
MKLHVNVTISTDYQIKISGYCNHLINVISFGLAYTDLFERHLLNLYLLLSLDVIFGGFG